MTDRPPPEGFEIRGRVVDHDDHPIPGVRIHALHTAAATPIDDDDPATTITDDAGTFIIAGVVGMHHLVAIDDEHLPVMTPAFDVDRPIADLAIVMKPGGVYAGRVVDAGGAPVAGARVHVYTVGPLGPRRREATSDASGAFVVKGLPRAPVTSYAAAVEGVSDGATVPLDEQLVVRDALLVLVPLDPAASEIAGLVVDDDGAPVAGVAVHVVSQERWLEAATTTDARGAFAIAGLPAGAYGIWTVDPEPTMARAGDTAVRLVVRRARGLTEAVADEMIDADPIDVGQGRSLAGTVVDENGRGVAGARVVVGRVGVFGGVGRFDEPVGGLAGAVTDASGAFAIIGRVETSALATAPLVVGADHPEHGRSLPVELATGDAELPPVTLALRACGAIAGTVTRDGQPIAGAIIGAGWPELGGAMTNDDGAFVIPRLPVGPVTLRARLPDEMMRAHQRTMVVEADRTNRIAIEIPGGGVQVSVDVKAAHGAAVAGAVLHLFPGTVSFDDYAQLSARLFPDAYGLATWHGDADRPARFENVTPGDFTLCAIPLAWSPHDHARMKLVYAHRGGVQVYCTPVRVLDAPAEQAWTIEVPAMAPLPDAA